MTGERHPLRVVFFGDSICKGQHVDITRGWVYRIAKGLQEAEDSREVVVANESINGNTTRQALERMHRVTADGHHDVQNDGADVLLVQFGMNDCNVWKTDDGLPRVAPEAFRANLTEIIRRGRVAGASEILLNTNHPTTLDAEPLPGAEVTYEAQNRRYNAIVREVAEAHEAVRLVDVAEAFQDYLSTTDADLPELVLDDGLHISEAGHDLYYETVFPAIERAVGRSLVDGT